MGILDSTALDNRLNDPANWKGTDDDTWLMRWRIKIKAWFAFSSRSPKGLAFSFVFFPLIYLAPFTIWFTGRSWWYLLPVAIIPVFRKWRLTPKILWAKKWGGYWRWEDSGDGPDIRTHVDDPHQLDVPAGYYLSRIQEWSRASVILFWPFCLVVHVFPYREDVGDPVSGRDPKQDAEIFFYRGWHYDDDCTFWGDGAAGPNFK